MLEQVTVCLTESLTQDQATTIQSYPTAVVRSATKSLGSKKVTARYFMGILKNKLSQHNYEKETQPTTRMTTSSTQEFDVSTLQRDLPEEDPMDAVLRICDNLATESTYRDGYVLTPAMKQRVAQPDPWWPKLDASQKAQVLTQYPFYGSIVGERTDFFQKLHQAIMPTAPQLSTPPVTEKQRLERDQLISEYYEKEYKKPTITEIFEQPEEEPITDYQDQEALDFFRKDNNE